MIDIEEIENSKREQWLRDNENYKCNPEGVTNTADCNYEKQCSENLVTIDLQKIVDVVIWSQSLCAFEGIFQIQIIFCS